MNRIIEISDFLAPELDVYARLSEGDLLNRRHPENGLFIAESPKVIARALDSGYVPVSCLVEKNILKVRAEKFFQEYRMCRYIVQNLIYLLS